jgi:lysophospholipid acyltransferase (LPLAT)-like uncharacterized protein
VSLRERLATGVIAAAVLLLARTLRWRVAGWRRASDLLDAGQPVVFAFWHGSAPLILLCRALPRVTVLVSRSRDGDRATALLVQLDQSVVRGSTSAGGPLALRGLLRRLRDPRPPTIAVDGPRGPRRIPGPGVGHLARMDGAWVVPLGAATRRGTSLRSWDRARLPWPGSRSVVAVGRPVRWEEAPARTAFDHLLTARLDAAEQRARSLCRARA